MKGLILILAMAVATGAPAATVVFPVSKMTGGAGNRRVTVTMKAPPVVNGTNLVASAPVVLTPTNGVAQVDLVLGDYYFQIEGVNRSVPFRVNTNGVFGIVELTDPNSLTWPQSNAVFYTRSEVDALIAAAPGGTNSGTAVAVGHGLVADTNNGLVTASISADVVTNNQLQASFGIVSAAEAHFGTAALISGDGSTLNNMTVTGGVVNLPSATGALVVGGTNVVSSAGSKVNNVGMTNGVVNLPEVGALVVGGTNVLSSAGSKVNNVGFTNGSVQLPTGSSLKLGGTDIRETYIATSTFYGRSVTSTAANAGKMDSDSTTNIIITAGSDKGLITLKSNVVVTGTITGSGAGLTNLPRADYTNHGGLTDTNFPMVEKLPNVRRSPPDWARVPFGGFNTWYQQNSTQYPPSAFQSPTNKWVWVTNQVNWAIKNNVQDFYKLIVIDDTWQNTNRLANGDLWWDPAQFPNDGNNGWSGMTNVINWLHSLGFKFGLYTELDPICAADIDSTGPRLPAPGSYGYYEQDAKLWSSWGVDYIKFDMQLDAETFKPESGLTRFVNAWDRTGRPLYIMGSVSPKGHEGWNVDLYNEPRTPYSPDWPGYTTNDYHFHLQKHLWWGRDLQSFVRPGMFASYDILPENMADGGNSGNAYNGSTPVSFELQRAMLTMGAMMVSPRIYTRGAVDALPNGLWLQTNRSVLKILTDPACIGSQMVTNSHATNATVWWRPLGSATGPEYAVALYNYQSNVTAATTIYCTWTNLGIASNTVMRVENAWSNEVFLATNVFSKSVACRGAELYRLTPVSGGTVLSDTPAVLKNTVEIVRANEWDISTMCTRLSYYTQSPAPIAGQSGISGAGNSGYYGFGFDIPSWATNVSGTFYLQVVSASTNVTANLDAWTTFNNSFSSSSSYFSGQYTASKVITATNGGLNPVTFSIPLRREACVNKRANFTLVTPGAETIYVVGPAQVTYQ